MKWLYVLMAVFIAGGTCSAGMDSNQLARVRARLKTLGASSFRPPDSFDKNLSWFLKDEGVVLEDTLPEAERLAIEANDNQDPANDGRKGGGYFLCARMLYLLGTSHDKRYLPTIERLALTAHNPDNRVTAVCAHIAICGFDSFEFVKRAAEAQPETSDGLRTKYWILRWALNKMNEMTLSGEQLKEIQKYLLVHAMAETNAPALVQADEFLVQRLPEYARSRQRLYFSGKRNVNDPTDQMKGYFSPVKDELLKLPPSELTDLRDRFPDLPPLPKENDAVSPLMIALAVGAGLAAACAAIVAVSKRRRTRSHADGKPENPR